MRGLTYTEAFNRLIKKKRLELIGPPEDPKVKSKWLDDS